MFNQLAHNKQPYLLIISCTLALALALAHNTLALPGLMPPSTSQFNNQAPMPHGPSHKTRANKIKSNYCISPKDTTPTLKDNLIISPIPTPYIVTPTPTPGILKKK